MLSWCWPASSPGRDGGGRCERPLWRASAACSAGRGASREIEPELARWNLSPCASCSTSAPDEHPGDPIRSGVLAAVVTLESLPEPRAARLGKRTALLARPTTPKPVAGTSFGTVPDAPSPGGLARTQPRARRPSAAAPIRAPARAWRLELVLLRRRAYRSREHRPRASRALEVLLPVQSFFDELEAGDALPRGERLKAPSSEPMPVQSRSTPAASPGCAC